MAMAAGAVHIALTRAGVRAEVGIAAEAGDCREIHHVAVLLGMGAGAVCPWLALETARSSQSGKGRRKPAARARTRPGQGDVEDGHQCFGQLLRCASVRCHRHLPAVVDKCFAGVPAPIGGLASPRLKTTCASSGAPNRQREVARNRAVKILRNSGARAARLRFCALPQSR